MLATRCTAVVQSSPVAAPAPRRISALAVAWFSQPRWLTGREH
jgi:hypothetical protein